MMMPSETSWPESITFFASRPSGVPALTAARSMSPVEICGMPYFSRMKLAWVPFPAPGGPKRIRRTTAAISISSQHSKHSLEVLRRIDARRNVGFAHQHGDAMAVPQRAQLLERLGALDRRRRQRRVCAQEAHAVGVDAGVAITRRCRMLARKWDLGAREIKRIA